MQIMTGLMGHYYYVFSVPYQTLQSMLASVKKGKPINEEDMPPPVATGGKPNVPPPQPEPIKEREQPAPNLMPSLPTNQKPLREASPVIPNVKPHSLPPPKAASTALTPGTPAISPLTPGHTHSQHSGTHAHSQHSRYTHTHTHTHTHTGTHALTYKHNGF